MKKWKILVYVLLLSSCIKEIPLDETSYNPRLVVNSIFCPDSIIKVQVSKTVLVTDTGNRIIDNANVSLYKEGVFLGSLANMGNGYYVFETYPEKGKLYEIKVDAPGFNTVTANEIIPEKTDIISCSFRGPIAAIDPTMGDEMGDINIVFKDNAITKNYYEIVFYWLINGKTDYIPIYNISLDIPVLKNEGDIDYEPSSIFFSDELFNGNEFSININMYMGFGRNGENGTQIEPPGKLYVILRSTSYNYYKYRKLWTRHYHNQNQGIDFYQDLFRGEPITMYTNVENGNGIFAGYSQNLEEAPFILISK